MWFWVALSSGLASAIDKVFNRIALKDRGNILAHSFLYISLITIFSFALSPPIGINVTPNLLILLLLQIIFWPLGTLLAFWSQSRTDVSLSMILSRARIIWMIPLGMIFLGERLSPFSIAGMLVIFFGFAILFFKESLHKHRGIHLMTASSIFIALGTIVNTLLVKNHLNAAQVTTTTMAGQSVLFLIVLLVRSSPIKRIVEVIKRAWYLILIAAAIETYAFTGLTYALKIGPASASTAIYLGMTITTIWIGITFLKERDYVWRKIISSAIVTLGIIIVKVFT